MNRHQRRAFGKNFPIPKLTEEVDRIADRILNGSATIRDIRTLHDFEGELRAMKDALHPDNGQGRDGIDAMIIEINDLLLDAKELSVVQ